MFWKAKATPEVKVYKSGNSLMINLYVKSICEARIQCVTESEETILIGDITHEKERMLNKGFGSAMMEKLISYAKENGYTRLYGNLSIVDLDHKERLFHYYEKFGFSITEYPQIQNSYFGRIEKDL